MNAPISPDPDEREIEILARERLNQAIIGALLLISLFAVVACGFAAIAFWPLL